jgi:cytochrome c-type biogenesis protein CcmE
MNNYVKFGSLCAVVVGTLAWLAVGGIQETQSYFKTLEEIEKMDTAAKSRKLRIGGFIEAGSIKRNGQEVSFVLTQNERKLNVIYTGSDALPDTFKDGAEALADGKLSADGVLHANKLSAKCASKYEVKPGGKYQRVDPATLVNKS